MGWLLGIWIVKVNSLFEVGCVWGCTEWGFVFIKWEHAEVLLVWHYDVCK